MNATFLKTLAAAAVLLLVVPSMAMAEVSTSQIITFEGYETSELIGSVTGTPATFDGFWIGLQRFPGRPAGDDTVALLLGSNSGSIALSTPASKIALVYSSAVPVKLTGRNAAGQVAAVVNAPANGFGNWALLSITATDNVISRLTIDSANNQIAIDDLTITRILTSPIELLENLIMDVADINLAQGINNAVDAKLDAALAAIVDANENNDVAACNALDALVHFVEVQWDHEKLNDEQAAYLIDATDQIIALLCPE